MNCYKNLSLSSVWPDEESECQQLTSALGHLRLELNSSKRALPSPGKEGDYIKSLIGQALIETIRKLRDDRPIEDVEMLETQLASDILGLLNRFSQAFARNTRCGRSSPILFGLVRNCRDQIKLAIQGYIMNITENADRSADQTASLVANSIVGVVSAIYELDESHIEDIPSVVQRSVRETTVTTPVTLRCPPTAVDTAEMRLHREAEGNSNYLTYVGCLPHMPSVPIYAPDLTGITRYPPIHPKVETYQVQMLEDAEQLGLFKLDASEMAHVEENKAIYVKKLGLTADISNENLFRIVEIRKREKIATSLFAWLDGFAYVGPSFNGNDEKMRLINLFLLLFFVVDDRHERIPHEATLKQKIERVEAILRGEPVPENDALLKAFKAFRNQVYIYLKGRSITSKQVDERFEKFIASLSKQLNVTIIEHRIVASRKAGEIPTPEMSRETRRKATGFYPMMQILRLLEDPGESEVSAIEDKQATKSMTKMLSNFVCDSIGACNNVASLCKELVEAVGEEKASLINWDLPVSQLPDDIRQNLPVNHILIESQYYNISLREAVFREAEFHKRSLSSAMEIYATLSGDVELTAADREFLATDLQWALANARWSLITDRYGNTLRSDLLAAMQEVVAQSQFLTEIRLAPSQSHLDSVAVPA